MRPGHHVGCRSRSSEDVARMQVEVARDECRISQPVDDWLARWSIAEGTGPRYWSNALDEDAAGVRHDGDLDRS